jgi:hypothetical protein
VESISTATDTLLSDSFTTDLLAAGSVAGTYYPQIY